MPIFDQGYQHWQGHVSGHAWRWWAITKHGVRTQFRGRWTKVVVSMALGPAVALAGFLVLWGLLEQKSSMIRPFLQLLSGLPEELRNDPVTYRMTVWTLAFHFFFVLESYFAMLIVLLVGPDLISKDLRFNALPLYLSRPLRRIDYFLGKLGIIGVYLALVTAVPVLVAYVLGVAFSMDWKIITATVGLLGAALASCAVVVVSAGTFMLAISSLTRNSRYVGAMWVGLWFVSGLMSDALYEALLREKAEWPVAVSYAANLQRIEEHLLDTESAWKKIDQLTQTGAQAAGQAAGGAMMRPGRQGMRPARPMPPPDEHPREINPFRHTFPWYWSAYVLAGLWGLSAWILSLRVKSLDRLK